MIIEGRQSRDGREVFAPMTASSAACAPSGAHDRPTLSVRRVVVRHSLLLELVPPSSFLMFGPEIAQLAARHDRVVHERNCYQSAYYLL